MSYTAVSRARYRQSNRGAGLVSIEADDDERGVVSQATGEMPVEDPGDVFSRGARLIVQERVDTVIVDAVV